MARFYTDAPDRYDGFGTQTVATVGVMTCGMNRGKPVRLVETPDEHAEWQRLRYLSGCYIAATQEQLDGNCKGLVNFYEGGAA